MNFQLLRTVPVDLMRYLPKFLAEDPNFKDVQETLSWEHEQYRLKIIDILKQFFVDKATRGLDDWERVYDLHPAPGDSYELRRARIKVKMRGVGTSTIAAMTDIVNAFVPTRDAVLHENVAPGVFRIDVPMYVQYMEHLVEMIDIYKPAHLTREIALISSHDLVIETKFGWLCYSVRVSGTYPRRQTLGKISENDIIIETGKGGLLYRNPYTGEIPAGVFPVMATQGELIDEAILVETEKGGLTYRNPHAGEISAGTFPETAQQGSVVDGDIVISTQASNTAYRSAEAGTVPERVSCGSITGNGITAATSAGDISYSARFCGRKPGSFM